MADGERSNQSELQPVRAAHLLAAAGAVGLVLWPLLSGRLLYGFDLNAYLIYGQQMAVNIRAGELLPAWASEMNRGFGSPALLFYPPLLNWIHAVPVLLHAPLLESITALAVVATACSGTLFYICVRLWAPPVAALAAAVVYSVAPYRMYDLYERGALAEHWSFLWPPLVLMALHGQRMPRWARFLLGWIGATALILTNLPMAVLLGGSLFCVAIWERHGRWSVVGITALALATSAFLLVPAAMVNAWTRAASFYGADAAGLRPSEHALFSVDHGATVSMCISAAAAFLAFLLLVRARSGVRAYRWAAVAAASFGLAVPGIVRMWDLIPILASLQFPWRTAAPLTLALAVLVSMMRRSEAAALALVVLLGSLSFVGARTIDRAEWMQHRRGTRGSLWETGGNAPLSDPSIEHTRWPAQPASLRGAMADVWFLPRQATSVSLAAIGGRFEPPVSALERSPFMLQGRGSARLIEASAAALSVDVRTSSGATLVWRALAFPCFRVDSPDTVPRSFVDPATGLIAARVEPPGGRVRLRWRACGTIRAARYVSLIAVVTGFVAAWVLRKSDSSKPQASVAE